jgi:hypothetical protein
MNLSEGANGLVDQAGQMLLGGDIRRDCDGAAGAVFGVDCVGHLAARLDIAGRDDDLCPLLCHPLDDRAPDSARGTGDQRHFPVQVEQRHGGPSPLRMTYFARQLISA